MAKKELNAMQQKFVAAYAGNATEAAKIAGYRHPGQQGERLLKKVEIAEAIKKRQEKESRPLIATRQERQRFWTETMQDADRDMKDRLKASELLGKSEADFTDKVQHDGSIEIKGLADDDLDRRIKSLLTYKG
jgi:phage terminase small subunit